MNRPFPTSSKICIFKLIKRGISFWSLWKFHLSQKIFKLDSIVEGKQDFHPNQFLYLPDCFLPSWIWMNNLMNDISWRREREFHSLTTNSLILTGRRLKLWHTCSLTGAESGKVRCVQRRVRAPGGGQQWSPHHRCDGASLAGEWLSPSLSVTADTLPLSRGQSDRLRRSDQWQRNQISVLCLLVTANCTRKSIMCFYVLRYLLMTLSVSVERNNWPRELNDFQTNSLRQDYV